jgi:hypothetical protein
VKGPGINIEREKAISNSVKIKGWFLKRQTLFKEYSHKNFKDKKVLVKICRNSP